MMKELHMLRRQPFLLAAFLFSAILVFFPYSVFAAPSLDIEWSSKCLNSTHLFKETQFYNGSTLNTYNQTLPCLNGCSSSLQACVPNDFTLIIWMALGLIFIVSMIYAGYMLGTAGDKGFLLGLPILMINIFFAAYLFQLDLFSVFFDYILAVLLLLDVLAMLYVLNEYWEARK